MEEADTPVGTRSTTREMIGAVRWGGKARSTLTVGLLGSVLSFANAADPAAATAVCDTAGPGFHYFAAEPALQYPGQDPQFVATALPASFTVGPATVLHPSNDVDYTVTVTDMDGNVLTTTSGRNGYCWTAALSAYPPTNETYNLTCLLWRLQRGPCVQAVERADYVVTLRSTGEVVDTGSQTRYVDLKWFFDQDLDHVRDEDDNCPSEAPDGPDRDQDGCTDPPACPEPTVAAPTPIVANAGRWLARLTISEDDGLVAQDVRLSGRRMAVSMGLPYVDLTTSFGAQRIELRPDGNTGNGARVRLVEVDDASGLQGIDVRAKYAVDWPEGLSASCLYVTQRYRFDRPRTKAQWNAIPGGRTQSGWCNPNQAVGFGFTQRAFDCGRFFPTVTYRFVAGPGETFTSLEAPQRLHLQPGTGGRPLGGGATSSGLFADCDTGQTARTFRAMLLSIRDCFRQSEPDHPVLRTSVNPLQQERVTNAVRTERRRGTYDNYHCQLGSRIPMPAFDPGDPWTPGAWGCPACVHIHWRWGTGANYAPDRLDLPRYTDGRPMVASTAQRVDIGVTTTGPETIDPVAGGWRALASDAQPVASTDQVLWYAGRSTASRDTFFKHGGFFADL